MKGLAMISGFERLKEPRNAGIACAFLATACGIFYLLAAGAPPQYLVVNSTAFLLGMVALGGLSGAASRIMRAAGPIIVTGALCLLGVALFGASADGAARWIWLGPLSVQLSLVLLPLMIIVFARKADAIGAAGMGIAALALALQPDRAMAGVLAFGLLVIAVARPGRSSIAAAAIAIVGFAISLLRPDSLPAVPFVDQILFTSFDIHILAGAAVVLGSALLVIPSILGWQVDREHAHIHSAFGAIWLGCLMAALLGNYPTPVVGYGGSFILGYLASLSLLPKMALALSVSDTLAQDDPAESSGMARSAIPA